MLIHDPHHKIIPEQPPTFTPTNMKLFAAALLAFAAISTAKFCPRYGFKVVRKVSHNAEGLKGAVKTFQALLGGKANGATIGPLENGFRVINWDGGAPFDMPFDFFNTNAPLGALFFAKGNKFAISNPVNNMPKDNKFDSINANAAKNFIAFSEKRLFTPVKGNFLVTKFEIPGKKVAATVSGFGAVYNDVNKPSTSFLELFDARGCRIAKVYVPPKAKGLSFVGIRVFRVRKGFRGMWKKAHAPVYKAAMKLGNTPITKKKLGYRSDIVVTDDFIYGEPQALKPKKGSY